MLYNAVFAASLPSSAHALAAPPLTTTKTAIDNLNLSGGTQVFTVSTKHVIYYVIGHSKVSIPNQD